MSVQCIIINILCYTCLLNFIYIYGHLKLDTGVHHQVAIVRKCFQYRNVECSNQRMNLGGWMGGCGWYWMTFPSYLFTQLWFNGSPPSLWYIFVCCLVVSTIWVWVQKLSITWDIETLTLERQSKVLKYGYLHHLMEQQTGSFVVVKMLLLYAQTHKSVANLLARVSVNIVVINHTL